MTTPPLPFAYFRANAPLRFPVQMAEGDYLGLMTSGEPQNLWVYEPTSLWVVRRGQFEEAKLWSVLDDLLFEDKLTLLYAPLHVEWLRRSLAAASSRRPALRVMRGE